VLKYEEIQLNTITIYSRKKGCTYYKRLIILNTQIHFFLVKVITAKILFKAFYNLLPANIQKLFTQREESYSLRSYGNFVIPVVRTTRRSFGNAFFYSPVTHVNTMYLF